jgi:hypothetical protein
VGVRIDSGEQVPVSNALRKAAAIEGIRAQPRRRLQAFVMRTPEALRLDFLLSGLGKRQARCLVRLQSFRRAGKAQLDRALGAMNVVSENVCFRSLALCLNGHLTLQW